MCVKESDYFLEKKKQTAQNTICFLNIVACFIINGLSYSFQNAYSYILFMREIRRMISLRICAGPITSQLCPIPSSTL